MAAATATEKRAENYDIGVEERVRNIFFLIDVLK